MFYIHLLRVKCETLPQAQLFTTDQAPVEIITESLRSKPTADVGRGSEWHIGNVEFVADGGISFAMGRTQAVKSPQFDSNTHDFLEEEAMRAPFAFGVFDTKNQVCGIVRKAGVSQKSREIANKLQILLNSSGISAASNREITVEPIGDPIGFIEEIRNADAVIRFSFTVSRPNPADVNRLIQKPAEEFTELSNGSKAKVEVEGENLDKDVIEDVAKAVASVGEHASASVRQPSGGRPKVIHLGGNPVVESISPKNNESVFEAILKGARKAYSRVRERTAN
ncbi:hypothetical protein [Rhizorhapis sp.]|uniref:hypothetical protein n=1 Tax=Rhizorhapis sp. TaxID=1968842 RepID=UPI002B466E69|nr:hypothetical protein [Rhizorhapis sp.]HKR15953.1 hypothetical protein [Rhizorhapis sp.]